MPINTTVFDRVSNRPTTTLNSNPRYYTTTDYTDGSNFTIDNDGTRVAFNAADNTTTTTYFGGPIVIDNNANLIETKNLAGNLIRTDQTFFNTPAAGQTTKKTFYADPSIAIRNITTVNDNGNITVTNGVTGNLINQTTVYPNGTI